METSEIKSKKRTEPSRRKHKVALELTKQRDSADRLIEQAEKRYLKVLKAQQAFDLWVEAHIQEGIIQKANESLEPKDQTETITLYSTSGQKRLYFGRQAKRFLDGRAHRAMSLIEEWLKEKEALLELDADSALIYEFLQGIFFGSRKKQFRWTPQLMQFITMDPKRIHDKRLREARELLEAAIRIDKSKWTLSLWRFDDEKNDYIKVDQDNFEELLEC